MVLRTPLSRMVLMVVGNLVFVPIERPWVGVGRMGCWDLGHRFGPLLGMTVPA